MKGSRGRNDSLAAFGVSDIGFGGFSARGNSGHVQIDDFADGVECTLLAARGLSQLAYDVSILPSGGPNKFASQIRQIQRIRFRACGRGTEFVSKPLIFNGPQSSEFRVPSNRFASAMAQVRFGTGLSDVDAKRQASIQRETLLGFQRHEAAGRRCGRIDKQVP